MFQSPSGEAVVSPAFSLPTFNQETVRHILLGDYAALADAIHRLDALGYCDRIAWSKPLPTGRSGEYISVMSRKRMMP